MVSTKLCGKMQISEKLLPVFIVFVYGFDTAWARETIAVCVPEACTARILIHALNKTEADPESESTQFLCKMNISDLY